MALVAGAVRLTLLTEIPPGLHGDEAWTGIDAQRVLDDGWIGPYVRSAFGQPTGVLYFAAPFVKLFGPTIFAVRLASAVLGIATVLVAYLTFRVMFDRPHAAFAALLLAVSVWHVHYSRLGFTLISWPFLELVTLFFLFLGIKTGRWLFYGLAGVALGAGVYTYNAYPIFAAVLGLFLAWLALRVLMEPLSRHQVTRQIARFAGRIGIMAALGLVVALPLILYVADGNNDFFGHHRFVSLFETEQWETAGFLDRADILEERAREFVTAAFWSGRPDPDDGAGAEAMVDKVSLLLIVVGIGLFLWRWRDPPRTAVLFLVALLPIATVVTTQGMFRQTFGMVPFLMLLAAAPLALWWKQSKTLPTSWRNASHTGIAIVLGVIAFVNLSFYFDQFPDTPVAGIAFGEELTDASSYMRDLPDDYYVYFYSAKWSFHYETRRYLAPDRLGEDRSAEFGWAFSLAPEHDTGIAYVFLDRYLDRVDEVENFFPDGTRYDSVADDGIVSFRAYLVPQSVVIADRPPGVVPTPVQDPLTTARDHDIIRVQDLTALQGALQEYMDDQGSYPNTGGILQTLCEARDLDAGCELERTLNPLPEDPLGDPGANGYWYISDGETYTLYAQRESETFPACLDYPDLSAMFDSILCFSAR